MSDFEYEIMQKKRTAHSARHKKNGSKSKRCSLPSDKLTKKQIKERCGPVITYNLNKSMKWLDFKALPSDVQAEYLQKLQRDFNVTAVDLGKMFEVQPLTVRKHVANNNLNVDFPRGRTMTSDQKLGWNQFMNGQDMPDTEDMVEQEEAEQTEAEPEVVDPVNAEPVVFNIPESENVPKKKNMRMHGVNLKFSGAIDVDMIANSLRLILGNESEGELEIICNLM